LPAEAAQLTGELEILMTDEKGPTPPPTQPVEKMLVIPLSLAQAVLNYLAKQPCGEVYNFVGALMGLKEVPSPTAGKEEKPAPPALVRKRPSPVADSGPAEVS
jgi:hypothetical protein